MNTKEIQSALETALSVAIPTTPTAWQNVAFDPDIDAVDSNDNRVVWVSSTNKPGAAEEADFLDGQRLGNYIIQVFGPSNVGTGDVSDIAKVIELAFRRKTISGVECGEAYTNDVGPDGRGWYQINVVIPWLAWIKG